jgi:hypothetical protein
MTSIDEMTEAEAKNYMDTELKALRSVLGDALIPIFWKALITQWGQEGQHGISPPARSYSVQEISKITKKWMEARSAAH